MQRLTTNFPRVKKLRRLKLFSWNCFDVAQKFKKKVFSSAFFLAMQPCTIWKKRELKKRHKEKRKLEKERKKERKKEKRKKKERKKERK